MDNAQILKGLLEGCILKLIEKEETYGYKICEDLSNGGFQRVNEGTIYPILIRLEKKGHIRSVKKDSPFGPKRKYFLLTEEGRQFLRSFQEEWKSVKDSVEFFMQ